MNQYNQHHYSQRHHLELSPNKRQLSHDLNDWTHEEELDYQYAAKKIYELKGYIYDPEILDGEICDNVE